jgi:hypothetical protein
MEYLKQPMHHKIGWDGEIKCSQTVVERSESNFEHSSSIVRDPTSNVRSPTSNVPPTHEVLKSLKFPLHFIWNQLTFLSFIKVLLTLINILGCYTQPPLGQWFATLKWKNRDVSATPNWSMGVVTVAPNFILFFNIFCI